MGGAYRQGRAARAELIGELTSEMQQADNGAPPPNSFPAQAARLAPLGASGPIPRIRFPQQKPAPSRQVPRVRILLPPARGQLRTRLISRFERRSDFWDDGRGRARASLTHWQSFAARRARSGMDSDASRLLSPYNAETNLRGKSVGEGSV
jgi:hypothetical protein